MKTIEEMIRSLARSDVTEFAIVSDRLPCIKVNGAFQPIDDVAPSTDNVLEMLVSAGGSRYVDALGPKASQWTTRVDGIGTVGITALMRNEIVQARFVLVKRDERAEPVDDGPTLQVPAQPPPVPSRQMPRVGRADIDPRARGAKALSPPPPAPAAAAALVGSEPVFDLEGTPAERAAKLAFDDAPPESSSKYVDFYSSPTAPRSSARDVSGRDGAPDESGALRAQKPPPPPPPPPPRLPTPPPLPPTPREELASFVSDWTSGTADGSLDDLFVLARRSNASDLHIVPERPVLLRIAGELLPNGPPVDARFVEAIVHATVPGRLRRTLDAEGSCDFALTDGSGRCRVNVARQRTGYKVCVRLISGEIPTLESLGLPEQIAAATHHHQGLILVTGPTGHGKTTTLAAIVDIINRETTRHVITVEDPVEYVHPRKSALMSQREVGAHTRTFASALKGSLREDPDVIVVGELRDTETVRMALSASETGHLMIGTMNTPSAAKTIDRLIDLFPPSDQAQVRLTLAGGLRLIVSQRLLPNTDRTGLVAACEILPGSISLWSLIRDNKTYQIPSLQQRGKGLGIIRFDDSLIELVKSGRTSLEIAKQWAESAEEVEMTVLNKRPVAVNPMQAQGKPMGEGAKEAVAGILGKAGNLFRKGT